MKLFSLNFLVVLISIFFWGCSENEADRAKIKYGMAKYEKNLGNCDSTNLGCVSISFEYPEIKYTATPDVKDSISGCILRIFLDSYRGNEETKTLDELADSLLTDFKRLQSEFPDFQQSWEIRGSSSIIYNDNLIVSLQTEMYSYTGGAHPNSRTYFANFNSQNGKKILLVDVVKESYNNELNIIAERIFRKGNKLETDQSLEEAGYWFIDNKFALNENFGIKNDGLIFYFNSYEIAPYAMGPTEILIPYKEIKNLVKQDGLLNDLIRRDF